MTDKWEALCNSRGMGSIFAVMSIVRKLIRNSLEFLKYLGILTMNDQQFMRVNIFRLQKYILFIFLVLVNTRNDVCEKNNFWQH